MRIAVVAYSCEPNKGSEPGVAWDFVEEMSKRGHSIVVFTKADKQDTIAKNSLTEGVNFYYVNSPDVWLKSRFALLRALHYYLWNISCILYFKRNFKASQFDIVHHVTFVNDWMPSAGAFFGARFVVGPIGHHPDLPLRYLSSLEIGNVLKEVFRRLARRVARSVGLLTRLTHKRAETIFVINKDCINRKFSNKTHVLPAIAIDLNRFDMPKQDERENKPLKLYWAGNFIYWKAPEIAIQAFLKARENVPHLELHMFGASGEFSKISNKYGGTDRLFFHGRKNQKEFFGAIREMDAFLYPSFEGGGMVVLEAMACGKPVLGIRFGGLEQMVTNKSGILVDFVDYDTTVSDLAKHIIDLSLNPSMLTQLSQGARSRVRHFSVQHKCDVIESIAYC